MNSPVNREVHARFCERLGVKLPGATRPLTTTGRERTTSWALKVGTDADIHVHLEQNRQLVRQPVLQNQSWQARIGQSINFAGVLRLNANLDMRRDPVRLASMLMQRRLYPHDTSQNA
jgi:hypothetical protein